MYSSNLLNNKSLTANLCIVEIVSTEWVLSFIKSVQSYISQHVSILTV